MSSRDQLPQRYRQVIQRIAEAAGRTGRSVDDILMVAVTKNATPDQIRQLLELGHPDLGENRVQQLTQRAAMTEEFVGRHRVLTSPRNLKVPNEVRWHMIGHLQRNKVKPVLPLIKLLHSVDSLRLAEEVQAQAHKQDREVDLLIQVNPVGEQSKSGVSLPAAPHLIDQMQTMFNIRVRGLMCMAPYADDGEASRPVFERTAEAFYELKATGRFGEAFNILSMGMSNDFEVAVECGANVLRIGRALFGDGA